MIWRFGDEGFINFKGRNLIAAFFIGEKVSHKETTITKAQRLERRVHPANGGDNSERSEMLQTLMGIVDW